MNGTRRKMIQDAADLLQQAVELLAEAGDGEEEAFDNLPESLQESEQGGCMVKWYKPENGDLPPSGKKVLCLTMGHAGAGYIISHQEGKRWKCGANRTVVAWMYLPDPPKEPPVRKKRGSLDAGKAQALRNAGWKLAAIAEELGVSVSRISQVTAPAPPKRTFALEGNYTDWPEYNRPIEYL